MKRLLIIAGSDSGGGAGIQADIKTACAHEVFATTAITAVTAQNTQGVFGVEAMPAAFVAQQIKAVLDDIGADAIKIGMLANAEIINAVSDAIKDESVPVILDTVMVSTSGDKLLEDSAVEAMKSLINRATLTTPNIPEAEILADMKINNVDDMIEAANIIGGDIVLKGGHLDVERLTDILLIDGEVHKFETKKLDTPNTHGTGCTLASAIACNMAKELNIIQSIKNACEYVQDAIQSGPDLGQGKNKPLKHNI